MSEGTLKAFVLEYAKVHGYDPIDIAMIAGALTPDYLQSQPECLMFVMELKTKAPNVFDQVKFIKNAGEKNK
jgi:hypothetical protein